MITQRCERMPLLVVQSVFITDDIACASPETCEAACGNPAGCSNIALPRLVMELLPPGN